MTWQEVIAARNRFYAAFGGTIGMFALVHMVSKIGMSPNTRFLFTIGFFASVFGFLWSLTKPREEYFEALFQWRYEDSGPALEQAWKLFLHAVNRLVLVLVFLVGAFFLTVALKTLSLWPAFSMLAILTPVYDISLWVALAALCLFPFVGNFLVSEAINRYRLLSDSVVTSGFSPRRIGDIDQTDEAQHRANVEITGDHAFYAGEMDWTWEDFYKNAIVFGQSGTGKTLCVLNALLDGLLRSSNTSNFPPSGLILDPKGDFHEKIYVLARHSQRGPDLLILDPTDVERSVRWNPLDSDDDELEIAARFAAVMETLGMKSERDSFWIDAAKKFLRHAIALIRLTNPQDEPPSFQQVYELSTDFVQISERADQLDDDDPRGDQCLAFFANEWVKLAEETRSSIQAYLTNMIDPFLMPPYSTLFSGRSTIRTADIVEQGKLLYVYMPIADREAMSKMVCTFVKLEFFREILKRPNKKRASFFFCDEFQSFFTVAQGKGDADFFERSRQSRHANIISTQNLPSLRKVADKEDAVNNLLGNCAVKIFLRNTDEKTNEYASNLFGQKIVSMFNQSISAGGSSGVRPRIGSPSSSQGSNNTYDAEVRKEVFTRLGVPSREEQIDFCESVIHLASRARVEKMKQRWRVHPLTD